MKKLWCISVLLGIHSNVILGLPSFKEVRDQFQVSETVLLDNSGKALSEGRTDPKFRALRWTPVNEVPRVVLGTMIKVEDKRFYAHSGVDYQALLRAALLRRGGGSTLSMQLVQFLKGNGKKIRPKSLWQKWQQMQLAESLEKKWSKSEILEAYLNLVSFRGELKGIRSASRVLFQKEPSGLTEEEGIVLSALIRSPNATDEKLMARVCMMRNSCGQRMTLLEKRIS
jgi:penicillin-binding protein 1C